MPNYLKAMIVVLVIATVVFRVAIPVALQFSSAKDFARRRNIWLVLTITGFLSPTFWFFVLVAAPLLVWGGRRDTNPLALYLLLLHVIPPIPVNIPVVGINELFPLDMYRLLSFSILFPLAWRLKNKKSNEQPRSVPLMDLFLLAFGALQIVLFVRPDTPNAEFLHDSITNVLRRAFLFFSDTYVLYYVVSRYCSNRAVMIESLASFCLACSVMAPLAVFEGLRHWALYADIGRGWGTDLINPYLERAGSLRATVSAGHPLALGYVLTIGFGFWLYLRTRVQSTWRRVVTTMALCLGVLFAYSRGPWIGAVAIYFTFMSLGQRMASGLIKAIAVSALAAAVLITSPLGDRIIKVIPFMGGTIDTYNIEYRHRLAERSLELVWNNPVFGDQHAYAKLHDLYQGVGVIDFVNVYADIAVFYGLFGLFVFVSFIMIGLIRVWRVTRKARSEEPDFALLGACISACVVGTLIMIYSGSFIFGYAILFYVLAGLAAAYVNIGRSPLSGRP